jgi:hypothetical protein
MVATGLAGGTAMFLHATIHPGKQAAAATVSGNDGAPTKIPVDAKRAAQQLQLEIRTAGNEITAAQEAFAASPRALADWHVVGRQAANSYLDLLHSLTRIAWPGEVPAGHVNAVVEDALAMRSLVLAVAGASSIAEAQEYSHSANVIVRGMRDHLDVLESDLRAASA